MQIQYFFYGVENLCTLLPSARVIHNHPVISFSTDSYRTVLTSTKPYFTAQRYSTGSAQTSPTQSSVLSTRTVLSLMNAQSPTMQSPFTKQSPTVQSSTVQQSSTVKSPTVQPPTMLPPTVQSSTVQPLTVQPPTMLSSSTVQPPTVQMQFQMQLYLPKFEFFPMTSKQRYGPNREISFVRRTTVLG